MKEDSAGRVLQMMQRKLYWKLSFCRERKNRNDSHVCPLLLRSPAQTFIYLVPAVDQFLEDLSEWKRGH